MFDVVALLDSHGAASPAHHAAQVIRVDELRAPLWFGAFPSGVWVTRIGHAPEWQPTQLPHASARCAYCHTLALDGSRCPSCGAPR